jgi:riboflavin kinase/FMN adenylyltransferase
MRNIAQEASRDASTVNTMQFYTDIHTLQAVRPTALTIGNFDGVHHGHQALLRELRRVAAELIAAGRNSADPAASGLLTFDPHPLAVLRPEIAHKLLTTPAERLHLAAGLGLDLGIIQPFTRATAALEATDFMALLKQHLNLAALVVGPDFALGRNRSGNLDVLTALGRELDYQVIVIEPVEWRDRSVRSSHIRGLLVAGQVEEAAELLGRLYHVTGKVVMGDQRGRQIGIPTANLQPPPDKLWPADGVYATRTWIHTPRQAPARVYASVTNLGTRPTVDGLHHRFETHLLDFPGEGEDGDLYGQTLTVEFTHRLRGERKFNGLAELVAQIHTDIATARALLDPSTQAETATQPFFLAAAPA